MSSNWKIIDQSSYSNILNFIINLAIVLSLKDIYIFKSEITLINLKGFYSFAY